MDEMIKEAIAAGQIPGAVIVIGHKGRVVFQKAYGYRALVPRREPMTLNTIFDIASLTKVVATTSAIAKLVEDGKGSSQREGHGVYSGIPGWQKRHHRSQPTDAFLGDAAGYRSGACLVGS